MKHTKLFCLMAILGLALIAGCSGDREAQGEWEPLFASDLSNAVYEAGGWEFKDGILSPTGHGEIWTKEQYGDFQLELEFKLAENANSGVFLRCGDIVNWLQSCIEVQVLDSSGVENPSKHDCGAIFDILEPSKNMVKEPGQWNRYVIICKGPFIKVELNGEQIIDMDLDKWTETHKNPDGTKNKFNAAYKDMPRVGAIGLQYHGHPVWYHNLRIKKL